MHDPAAASISASARSSAGHRRQAHPGARQVATALTQSGPPVHFSTLARWKLQDLLPAKIIAPKRCGWSWEGGQN
jgi:hypothetical protein